MKYQKKMEIGLRPTVCEIMTVNLVRYMGWSQSKSNFAAEIMCSLLSATGVWHKKIALSMCMNTLTESIERRIQRFFFNSIINLNDFSYMLVQMLNIKGKVTIIFDRTNWDYGDQHINLFVAAILYQAEGGQRFAIPIAWEVFDHSGSSNTQQRERLMNRLINLIGKDKIEAVLGDREFLGQDWFEYLNEQNIQFNIRLREGMYIEYEGKRITLKKLFSSVKYKEQQVFLVSLNGLIIRVAATRSIEDELVIVAVSVSFKGDPLAEYRLRWFIELLFKSTKTKGFNIEETHMTDPSRISMLFALISLATLCAVKVGVERDKFKKIPVKNHGRAEFSLFTYGLDFLRALCRGATCFHQFFDPFQLLSIPPNLDNPLIMG